MAMSPFITFLVTRKTSPVETEPRGIEPLRDGSLPSAWATIPPSNAHAELASTYAFLGFRALPTTEHVFF